MKILFIFCCALVVFNLVSLSESKKQYGHITVGALRRFFPYNSVDEVENLAIRLFRQNTTKQAKRMMSNWIDRHWPFPKTTVIPDTVLTEEVTSTTTELVTEYVPYTQYPMATVTQNSNSSDSKGGMGEMMDNFKKNHSDWFAGSSKNETNWEDEWFKNDPKTTTPYPYPDRCRHNKEFIRQQILQFLDHRDTVEIYIEYLIGMVLEDMLVTVQESKKIRRIFWRNDRLYNNNFLVADPSFRREILENKWKKSSPSKIQEKFMFYTQRWYKFPGAGEKLDWKFDFNSSC
ncbi:hypothetical protein CAEBREN_25004 [Caenorhabditis brenneri]|uniref:Uncharacterized protein n=1 Tax=Caenorhabditis brenneri TaxID=135651 RepID=G0NQT2_CAEBE|nr:hypothetical protein CAEBREN_25004 [Caenorhabditis brenneri]